MSSATVFAAGESGSEFEAALTRPAAARSMSFSYRSRESAVSWPPARKPLEAAVLASAR
ncbi:hypothetical protein QF027_003518 [Streptomyces canus]|nr:hypothetical protein [Streptomyces canus]